MKGGVRGPRKGRSFVLDDLTYGLFDNVFFEAKNLNFYIGKVVKIWEEQKMIEIVWFFQPHEIRGHLGDYEPLENEIFLACGTADSNAVCDLNKMETVAGKCRVICTSKDARNPQPSDEDVARADYVFSRIFDVESRTLSEILPETIAFRDIRAFLNREEDLLRSNPVSPVSPLLPAPQPTERKRPREDENTDEMGTGSKKRHIEGSGRDISAQRGTKLIKEDVIRKERGSKENGGKDKEMWKGKEDGGKDWAKDKEMGKGKENEGKDWAKDKEMGKGKENGSKDRAKDKEKEMERGNISMKPPLPKKRDSNGELKNEKKLTVSVPALAPQEDLNGERRLESPVEKPDKSKWFAKMPWNDRVEKADQDGTLVFLENFDPSYNSSEIEDLIQRATTQKCNVRPVKNYSYGDPTYGEAYAIFQTKEAANSVVYRLNKDFLFLPDGRALYCSKGAFNVPKKSSSLIGHLAIDKLKIFMREEMKKAVSTSHCSQANTIEFDFAMEWILNQEKYERARSILNKNQLEERRKFMQQK